MACPGVPGTRGIRIGASNEPFSGSMSSPGYGMERSKLSESGLYALTYVADLRRRHESTDRLAGSERSIMCGAWCGDTANDSDSLKATLR